MILRPQSTRLLPPALGVSPPISLTPLTLAQTQTRVALNLKIKQLNVEGLASSERGVFVAAFQARVKALANAAGSQKLRARFLDSSHAARIRRIDGGILPSVLDAKRMGERAANTIFRELLR